MEKSAIKDTSYEKTLRDVLEQLSLKIDSLAKLNERILDAQMEILRLLKENSESTYSKENADMPDAMALWSLPSSLRRTMLAIYKLGEATAGDLSNETERLRAVESALANQLVRLGYLRRKRLGRKVYFYVENDTGEG